MTEEEAISWIHSQLKFGIKPGLERMQWLLNELGNPQDNLSAVHIVGTNGKGSTTSYLQHIFSQAGYEVGTFTSPYLVDFRERISLNGEMISREDFLYLVEQVKPLVERLPIETHFEEATEFEIITVLMFLYFGEVHPVDIAFIEAGMGGLYDSTNNFKALVVVCPSIGLDHQAVLGNTYTEIAQQKVGVLDDAVPLVFATNRQDVRQVFLEKAKQTGSSIFELGDDFFVNINGNSFDYKGKLGEIKGCRLTMLGEHQIANASLAITTSLLLKDKYPKISNDVIRLGLEKTHWGGRTELIFPKLMIDGAHNNESVAALVEVLKYYQDKKIHILFAAIDTKPVDSMLEVLSDIGNVVVTTFDYPNAVSLSRYPNGYNKVASWKEWLDGVDLESNSDFYVITGSLYFISQVRSEILSRNWN